MLKKNPVTTKWYADPEARVYNGKLYLYVTRSAPFEMQCNLDILISNDLIEYERKESILDLKTFSGVECAVWAPTVIEKSGRYYLIFAANNIHSDDEPGGLYIGVSDNPDGKFSNVFADGRPLLNKIIHGAQPIDAHLFDDDGKIYLYYGGWGHLNVCVMNDTMDGFVPFSDGQLFREITPDNYVEAPCVFKREGKYYLMYSSGDWGNGTYAVHYGVSDFPCQRVCDAGVILSSSDMAGGPGHNGYFQMNGEYYVAYHRRLIGDKVSYHRLVCVDRLNFDGDKIKPIDMT